LCGQGRKKNMTKKIWRLSERPTADDLATLVEAKILTNEEAKDIVLRDEKDIPTDQLKEIKDELKLLREIVLSRISEKEVKIIEHHHHDYWPKTSWYYTTSNNPGNWTTSYLNASNDLGTIGALEWDGNTTSTISNK
jgi:hypothetical protein